MGPVQQAFTECHGLQCGFCTPGFLTTITAYLEDHPHPTAEEAREAISGNLCRCTGYQNIVEVGPARRRDRATERARRGDAVTTQMFGAPVRRREDPRLVTGGGRYLDDLGHDALAAAFVRSPHAHARIVDIDVTDALDVDGLVGIWTHEDLPGRVGEPLPLLIPHPTLTHGRTQYALARDEVNYVGEAVVMVVARDRYAAEDACAADPGRVRACCPRSSGIANARDGGRCSCTRTCPATSPADMLQEVGDVEAAIAAAPHALELDLDIERSACMPMEGKGVLARWDAEQGRAAHLLLHPDVHRACAPPSRPSSTCRWPRSSASRPTWAAASASRSTTPGPRRCSSPGLQGCSTRR